MQGGWGAVGTGAWGAGPPPPDDDDVEASAPPPPKATSSFKPSPINSAPPAYATASSPVPSPSTGNGNAAAREAELRKREAQLAERERAVAARERELGVNKKPNWPICYPLWYHNIGEEIPESSRRVVREAYACFLFLVVMLSYQFAVATIMLGFKVGNKIPSWFLSIIFWVMGVPLAILLWYKRLYVAAKDDSTFGYIGYFLFFFCHFAFCVFCAVGPQINAAEWCFSGFMAAFSAFDVGAFNGVIYLAGGGGWSLLAVYSLWVLKDSWYFFRGQGGVKQVQEKAAQEAALAAFTQNMGGGASRGQQI